MRRLILLLSLIFILLIPAYGQDTYWYGGFHMGYNADEGEGAAQMDGPYYGLMIGKRKDWWGYEVGYSKHRFTAAPAVLPGYTITKAELEASVISLGVNFYLGNFLTFMVGFDVVSTEHDIAGVVDSITVSSSGGVSMYGVYLGMALGYTFFDHFELFGEGHYRSWSEPISFGAPMEVKIVDFGVGLKYHF